MSSFFRFLLLFGCILLISITNWYCGTGTTTSPEQIAKERTTYAGLSDSAHYVGMNTCKGCHASVHGTFIHTGMGQSFDVASPTKSKGVFSKYIQVKDEFSKMNYHPSWENGKLIFKEYRVGGGETIYARNEMVKYIVGSGQHTNSHIWESNGYLFQAPMTFYTQKGKWDLPPGFENGQNSRFGRKIGLECMTCHNGYPKMIIGSENKYSKVESGIDCERCHGPGSIHVLEKSMGILIDTSTQIDYSIVNPSKLPIDLQFDVCQRCHVQGNTVLKEGKSFFDFKPGMRLSDVMYVFMPVYKGDEDEHIMASHAERLKMSKCFISTVQRLKEKKKGEPADLKPYKNGLTCLTCHNPHVSVKMMANDHFNQACNNCHAAGKEDLCSRKKDSGIKGNDCVSCHMPVHGTSDIPHVSVHDHRIAVPTRKTDVDKMKTFIDINCLNDPNPPKSVKAQAYINYVEKFGMDKALLDSAWALLPLKPNEKDLPIRIHIHYLKGEYNTILSLIATYPDLINTLCRQSYDNRDAWTSYRIGEAAQLSGKPEIALRFFKNAYTLAPLHPEFTNKYANLLAQLKDFSTARALFKSLVKEHPYFAPAYSNLGLLILIQDKNSILAHQLFDKALALDPDYELAILNKAAAFITDGKKDEARAQLKKVLEINPSNQQATEGLRRLERM